LFKGNNVASSPTVANVSGCAGR
jgi:hypothetical protein